MAALAGLTKEQARAKLARDSRRVLVQVIPEGEPDIFEKRGWHREHYPTRTRYHRHTAPRYVPGVR